MNTLLQEFKQELEVIKEEGNKVKFQSPEIDMAKYERLNDDMYYVINKIKELNNKGLKVFQVGIGINFVEELFLNFDINFIEELQETFNVEVIQFDEYSHYKSRPTKNHTFMYGFIGFVNKRERKEYFSFDRMRG